MTDEELKRTIKEIEKAMLERIKNWSMPFSEWTLERKEKTSSGDYIVTFSGHWKREPSKAIHAIGDVLIRLLLAGGLVFAANKLCGSIKPCLEHERALSARNERLEEIGTKIEAGFSNLSDKNEEVAGAVRECGDGLKQLSATDNGPRGVMEVGLFMYPCRRGWHPYCLGRNE